MGTPLIPGLSDDLAGAARRLRRRRRSRATAVAAATVALLVGAVTVTSVLDTSPAQAGVKITTHDGQVFVQLITLEARPAVVEEALRDAGIDADVTAVPVGPSNVGRFVGLAGDDLQGVEFVDSNGVGATAFAVPTDYRGHLDIRVGRPAASGEDYALAGNALSREEPLACLDLIGQPARELVAISAAAPQLDLQILAFDGDGRILTDGTPAGEVPRTPYASWRIVEASAIGPDIVRVIVTADGESPFLRPVLRTTGCD